MIKDFEQIKKQLVELSQAVNAFKSEAVQLRIVELIFKIDGHHDNDEQEVESDAPSHAKRKRRGKTKSMTNTSTDKKSSKPKGNGGATDVLRQLVTDGFFSSPKMIGEVVKHCNVKLAKAFKANELSPGLVKLVREKVLDRDKDKETKQYKYRKK
jgi:hypothetical protein